MNSTARGEEVDALDAQEARSAARAVVELGQLRRRAARPVRLRETVNLVGLFAPCVLFVLGLLWLGAVSARFDWVFSLSRAPWELWVIAVCGGVATAGGVGDWLFHRRFVTVGPKEHHSHKLALLAGGLPLFLLMAAASVVERPAVLLLPVMAVALTTTALICYDEFVFHRRRCTTVETVFHRLLVFGNGAAWMAWCHFCFVREVGP